MGRATTWLPTPAPYAGSSCWLLDRKAQRTSRRRCYARYATADSAHRAAGLSPGGFRAEAYRPTVTSKVDGKDGAAGAAIEGHLVEVEGWGLGRV